MPLKAILFDLDDTLIDWGDFSEAWETVETPHITKVYDYMTKAKLIDCTFEVYKTAYFKRTRDAWRNARTTLIAPHMGKVLLATALEMGMVEDASDMDALLDTYEWGRAPQTTTFPEAVEVLGTLRDAGVQLGMVTNAFQPMRLRDVELEQHGLLEFFPSCRISAADVGVLKPHPEIFKQALDCIGTAPEDTVFIGDNPTADIAGAQAAGMRAILRVTGRRTLISGLIVPDAAINTLIELMPIFDEWFPGCRPE